MKLGDSYKSNLILRFLYDRFVYMGFSPNIVLVPLFFWLLYLLAYAYYGYLFTTGDAFAGFLTLESPFTPIMLVVIPLLLYVMKMVYDNLDTTMQRMREISELDDAGYSKFKTGWKRAMDSPIQFYIGAFLLVAVLANTVYKNVTVGATRDTRTRSSIIHSSPPLIFCSIPHPPWSLARFFGISSP